MHKQLLAALLVAISGTSLVGCFSPPPPPPTQMEVRQFQTRVFDTSDTKLVVKAMIDVLQDDGFVVRNVSMDVGFLSASKEVDVSSSFDEFLYAGSRYEKCAIIEATANISPYGSQTKVRMTFQEKILDNLGAPKRVYAIKDATYYQNFFEKVSKGLFFVNESL